MNIQKIIFALLFLFYSVIYFFFVVWFAYSFRLFKKCRINKALSILIAGVETSNNIRQITSLISRNIDAHIVVVEFVEHPFYKKIEQNKIVSVHSFFTTKQSDHLFVKELKKYMRSLYLFAALFRHDVVLFNWTNSFLAGNFDYILFKLAGIKLIVRHCGDDVRYRPLQHGVHKCFGIHQWDFSSRSLLRMFSKLYSQSFAEKFAIVLSSRDFATFQKNALAVRPYIQIALPRSSGLFSDRALVLHAPSDRVVKGTDYVIRAIEILKNKNIKFDFLLLENKSHADVIEALSRTTILIDQPGAFPARLATEGFASGCVVIGGNVPEIHGFTDCPALQFPCDALSLAELLEDLICHSDKILELSKASIFFWKNHCSEESFVIFFNNLMHGNFPTFNHLPNHADLIYSEAKLWYEKIAIKLRYGI